MSCGTELYVALVFSCAISLRWGIVVLLLLIEYKEKKQSTRVVWPLGLAIRTRCVAPWVRDLDPVGRHYLKGEALPLPMYLNSRDYGITGKKDFNVKLVPLHGVGQGVG